MNSENKNIYPDKSFSNEQNKLFAKYKEFLGEDVARALLTQKNHEPISFAEIAVIVEVLKQFRNIKINGYANHPKGLILKGSFIHNYYVNFYLQHKVQNNNPKAQSWAIDLVIELWRDLNSQPFSVGKIGLEYDGFIGHFVEREIKKTFLRDTSILAKTDIYIIHMSPDGWKKEAALYLKAIKKFLRNRITQFEDLRQKTIQASRTVFSSPHAPAPALVVAPVRDHFEDCPVCYAKGYFGPRECPLCKGYGRMRESELRNLVLSMYNTVDCLSCLGSHSRRCRWCGGSGLMDTHKAMEYSKKQADSGN